MYEMFYNSSNFNQPLNNRNVSSIEDISFRQSITAWKLCSQSTLGIFLDLPDYRDMESCIMWLAVLEGNDREYELQEMIKIFGEEAVHEALRLYGAKYGFYLK